MFWYSNIIFLDRCVVLQVNIHLEVWNATSGVAEEEGALRNIWCGGPCSLLSLFDCDIIFILNIYRMFWKIPSL
jgi:hypothetical protein